MLYLKLFLVLLLFLKNGYRDVPTNQSRDHNEKLALSREGASLQNTPRSLSMAHESCVCITHPSSRVGQSVSRHGLYPVTGQMASHGTVRGLRETEHIGGECVCVSVG